jgi:hypothetical protein
VKTSVFATAEKVVRTVPIFVRYDPDVNPAPRTAWEVCKPAMCASLLICFN